MWTITTYNGTIWESKSMVTLTKAIQMFCKETGLHEMDIKSAINKH